MSKCILGLGCDRGTSIQTLNSAINNALKSINFTRSNVTAVATIDKKNDELAILELAKQNQWPLKFFTASQLASIDVPNPSKVVLKYMGTPAVAEAAAMLAANVGIESLVLEKYKYLGDDNKNATVSIVKI